MAYKIYTDGGYSIPRARGGWAFVVVKDDKAIATRHGNSANSTSNQMELTALVEALKYIKDKDVNDYVTILSDSNYIVNGYSKWMIGWRMDNWLKKDGKEVKNKHLWEQIWELRKENIKVKWVKGHNGDKFNEIADQLTRAF